MRRACLPCHTEFSFAAALAPLKLKLLSDARRQLLARGDLAPSEAAHAIKGLCSHYGYLIEDVEMWDKGNFPLEDVPPVPDEDLADVREAEHYLRRQLPERIGLAVEEAAAGIHDTPPLSSEDEDVSTESEVRRAVADTLACAAHRPALMCRTACVSAQNDEEGENNGDDTGLADDEELCEQLSQNSIGQGAEVCPPNAVCGCVDVWGRRVLVVVGVWCSG